MEVQELNAQIKKTNDYLARMGELGENFRQAINSVRAREGEEWNEDVKSGGTYHAYNILRLPYNAISYSPKITPDAGNFFSVRVHEHVHALQHNNAAVLHYRSFNKARERLLLDDEERDGEDSRFEAFRRQNRIVLCPRDQIRAVNLEERDAYAKEAWLSYHLTQSVPGSGNSSALLKQYSDVFNAAAQKAHGSLEEALSFAADRLWPHYTTRYHLKTLSAHTAAMKHWDEENRGSKIIFVRADEDDLLRIGDSFGPNFFKPETVRREELSWGNRLLLTLVNWQMKVGSENNLPTLKQALEDRGFSEDAVLRYYRKRAFARQDIKFHY